MLLILEVGTPVINTTTQWCSGSYDRGNDRNQNKISITGIIIQNDRTTSCRGDKEPLYLIKWSDNLICSKLRYQFDVDVVKMRDDKINKLCY
jgi:hypothetical protein